MRVTTVLLPIFQCRPKDSITIQLHVASPNTIVLLYTPLIFVVRLDRNEEGVSDQHPALRQRPERQHSELPLRPLFPLFDSFISFLSFRSFLFFLFFLPSLTAFLRGSQQKCRSKSRGLAIVD